MWSIQQTEAGWVLARDGEPVGEPCPQYEDAVAALSAQLAVDDTGNDEGLLPESWEDTGGIAFSEALPGGRNFTNCEWAWRDPSLSLLPLMLQTETEMGHFGAQLAGFISEISLDGTTPRASGRFYDSDSGRAARDLLLGGRRFGVSVDATEDVEVEVTCVEEDEDGWCIEASIDFARYEIGGLTMTPFPAFGEASIQLVTADVSEPGEAVAASTPIVVSVDLTAPPAAWLVATEAEYEEEAVEQRDGGLAIPMTVTADGHVYGNLARWEQCHVGYEDYCVAPPESRAAYAHFNIGAVHCADGSVVAAGNAVVGCEHANLTMNAQQARDHYAHAGQSWASIRVTHGEFGPWATGVLRPDVTREQLAVIRALSFSGDWRSLDGGLELIGALAVPIPGFPIARESLLASGLAESRPPKVGARVAHRDTVALVASGIVTRCSECAKRAAQAGTLLTAEPDQRIVSLLTTIERRTRHLIPAEAAYQRDAIAASARTE